MIEGIILFWIIRTLNAPTWVYALMIFYICVRLINLGIRLGGKK